VEKLGQIGDVVKVKDGFARNYLLPKKKALRATKANLAYFETQRVQLEARNLEQKKEAEQVSGKLEGKVFIMLRQASDRGSLYGSVSPRDIADAITAGGFSVARTQVPIDKPIKAIGLHEVSVVLHPEVRVHVTINVARSEDEAERQARGEDVLAETAEEEAQAAPIADAMFEEGAGPKTEEAEPQPAPPPEPKTEKKTGKK
jgi:large subunit ribosomal protein L9